MPAMKQRTVDAWMFLAIAISPRDAGPVGLSDLVAAADGVNHAIPTEDELRGGINRLIYAGLVSEHEISIRPDRRWRSDVCQGAQRLDQDRIRTAREGIGPIG